MIQVEKRNGDIIDFDPERIKIAITKANNDLEYDESPEMNEKDIEYISSKISEEILSIDEEVQYSINVEEIQDIVERTLSKMFPVTAKKYILYRERHRMQRDAAENLMKLNHDLLFADSEEMDLKRDNANINTDAPMGIMLKLGTENAKMYLNNYVLPEEFREMHKKHIQHIHDADFSLITINCLYSDLGKALKHGFNTGHGFIRPPKSIRAAASLACILIQSAQNDCFGGQSLVGFDFALGKYVHISFQKYLKKALINLCKITNGEPSCRLYIDKEDGEEILSRIKYKDKEEDRKNMVEILGLIGIGPYFTIPRNNFDKRSYGEIIYNIACQNVEEETKQAMEALVFNFNSLHSRAGKN